jgi:hypothetical protein
MKIIFSKKGFDTSFGKKPSPIFPDGGMISLPIPDDFSNCPYAAIASPHPSFPSMEQLLSALGCKDNLARGTAHLDPDLRPEAKARLAGWRPVLGQSGSALGHLMKHGVTQDDIFLFYGLFQEVSVEPGGRLRFKGKKRQIIWGWLQVAEFYYIHEIFKQKKFVWLNDHPHMQACTRKDDAVFISGDSLRLPSARLQGLPGAGVFDRIRPELVLSYPEGNSFTNWRLPEFFYPFPDKTPLTYHDNKKHWHKKDGYCYLDRVSIGQEFILPDEYMPELGEWLHMLFEPICGKL